MRLRLALVAAAFLLGLSALAGTADAATTHFPLLTPGSRGKKVAAAQWLLGGHKPSAYSAFHFYKGKPTGEWGKRTTTSVLAMKWVLGYPLPAAHEKTFGPLLYRILTGQTKRPLGWIGRASIRIERVRAQHANRAPPCGRRIATLALHEHSLGIHEIPDGSNYSPRIAQYESITGAFRAAWCVSFAQWIYVQAGVGAIANRSAGVYYSVQWAHDHGWLRSRPAVGAWVAYLYSLGHMGVVVRVTTTGFWSVEGNFGNAVSERWHPLGYAHTVFVYPPCLR